MVFSGLFLEDFEINNLILIHVNYWNLKKKNQNQNFFRPISRRQYQSEYVIT